MGLLNNSIAFALSCAFFFFFFLFYYKKSLYFILFYILTFQNTPYYNIYFIIHLIKILIFLIVSLFSHTITIVYSFPSSSGYINK